MAVLSNTGIRAGASAVVAGGDTDYNLKRSTRFNPGDSAYLNRTPSSAGNRRTWTFSCWVKNDGNFEYRNVNYGGSIIFGAHDGNPIYIGFNYQTANLDFTYYDGSAYRHNKSEALFRDSSAWYHLVVALDTTQATGSDRIKMYANGVQLTNFYQSYTIPQNTELGFNTTYPHNLGACRYLSTGNIARDHFSGNLADVNFVDGLQLDATSFGETSTTGQWIPKEYTHVASPNDGTTWSDAVTGSVHSSSAVTKAFNGNTGDYATPAASNSLTFTPSSAITGITAVKVVLVCDISYDLSDPYTINGVDQTSTLVRNGAQQTHEYSVTSLSSIVWSTSANSHWTAIYAIYVKKNGNWIILLDGAVDNSFHLAMDPAEANPFGHDSSGNGNDWTANNLSTTAGAGLDLLADVPGAPYDNSLNGGANYATLNPLQNAAGNTFSNGNLQLNTNGSGWGPATSTIAMKTGKWYFEVECTSDGGNQSFVGIVAADSDFAANTSVGHYPVCTAYQGNATKYTGGGTNASYGASWGAGDIVGTAFDADNHTVTFYLNGVSQGAITSVPDDEYFFGVDAYHGSASFVFHANFGQYGFSSTPPTGYKALNTYNLPEPTIVDPSTVFDTALWNGTGSAQTVPLEFEPDMVWSKTKNAAVNHKLADSVRGFDKTVEPDQAIAEYADAQSITATSGSGFTLGTSNDWNNGSGGRTYVGWAWDAGSSAAADNTDGSITSSVKVNNSAGFSCVSYTGTGSTDTIGHGLNDAPKFIITKNRDDTFNWGVYHASAGPTVYLKLNSSDSASTQATWQNTAPTSSVFYVGNFNSVNQSDDEYIAYAWSEVAGYSRFSSFTGNGSADGPFVWCGFEPKYLLLRASTITQLWLVLDSSRDQYNVVSKAIQAHTSDAEIDSSTNYGVDFLSNGFKLRSSTDRTNGSGYQYVFCAFAESPFKYSNAR